MAKELYLYTPIYGGVAEKLISELNASMGKEVSLRANSPGGRVLDHWGIIAKMKEHGNVHMKVDGGVMSAAANMVLYAKKVSALKMSKFMFHRAEMYVDNEEDRKFLKGVNEDIKSRMLSKIDANKFTATTGISIDRMFDPNQERVDVYLSADQMKDLNLIDEVVEIDPTELTAFNERFFQIAAEATPEPTPKPTQQNNDTMTLPELKIKFPEIYQQAVNEGVEQEKDRVGAIMVFAEVDLASAKKIIASGKKMTQTEQAEFGMKLMSAQALKDVKADAAENITTNEPPRSKEDAKKKEIEAFEKQVKANLGIKEEKEGAVVMRKGNMAVVVEA